MEYRSTRPNDLVMLHADHANRHLRDRSYETAWRRSEANSANHLLVDPRLRWRLARQSDEDGAKLCRVGVVVCGATVLVGRGSSSLDGARRAARLEL